MKSNKLSPTEIAKILEKF